MSFSSNYVITEQIGSGAMATVHKAIQRSLDRVVAVKQILPHLATNPQFVERFQREARAAANLRHENILNIIDFGGEGEAYYIVVEYIDGPSLREMIAAGGKKLPVPLVLSVMTQLLSGLEYSHNNGVIHRDLKPTNIMVTSSGVAKIADFGIAHASALPSLTATGEIMGTPSYMSPEQATGRKIDQRSDLFSAGVVLYEMLSGELPFQGTSAYSLIQRIINEPHPPLRKLNADIPDGLARIVDRALEKDVTRRYYDATEFLYAIENFIAEAGLRTGARVVKEFLATAFNLDEAAAREKLSTSQMALVRTPSGISKQRPAVAILPLSGCFGCHVNLLDLHDGFERIANRFDVRYTFLMDVKKIPRVDIGIVEGCVANVENEERLRELRKQCDVLLALGTCACHGGIPGLRNLHAVTAVVDRAYVQSESTTSSGVMPLEEHVPALTDHVRAVPDVVKADVLIPGCPSPQDMVRSTIDSLLAGTSPKMPTHAVCAECVRQHRTLLDAKRDFIAPRVRALMEVETIDPTQCFLEQGVLCLGMATREGCGARCTKSNFPCQGCMGPAPNVREAPAKWIDAIGSLLPSGALRFRDDIVGFGYRFTLPVSMMPKKLDEGGS